MCAAPRAAHAPIEVRAIAMPISAISTTQLNDSWGDARSGGRRHQGIDIMAPRGEAVRAIVDGEIIKLEHNARGGISIYHRDARSTYTFYYAHLDGYAPELREGDFVRQGQVIAYVGSTGNATTPHLHLEIRRAGENFWRGAAINPYPSLIDGRIVDREGSAPN